MRVMMPLQCDPDTGFFSWAVNRSAVIPKRISTGSSRLLSRPKSFFYLSPSQPFLKTQLEMLSSTGHA